ncbi:hypothetical protein KJ567_07420 [Candidatus Bipolaricaulota bacterium]|nr:hypothetical protein [Candidatus Bipolaricaulota bacterium]
MRVGLGALLVVLSGCAVLGQGLCDFNMPVSHIRDADMSFAYRHVDDATTAGVDDSAGRFSGSYSVIYDSDVFGYSGLLNTNVALTDFVPTLWRGLSSASYRYYISRELPLFVYGGVSGSADTALLQPGLELRGGLGYGRFRDVTPLAMAYRISDALLAAGTIASAPSPRTLRKIADTLAPGDDEVAIADLVSALEGILESASGVALDSTELLLIEEELEQWGEQRFCGMIVQMGVGQELLDASGGPRDVLYVMSADAAWPPTPSNQLRIRSTVSTPFDVLTEHALLVELTYAASLLPAAEVRSSLSLRSVRTPGRPDVSTLSASANYSVGAGRASVVAGVLLSHTLGSPGWTVDVSISASVDLL